MQDICGSGMFGLEISYTPNNGPGANFQYQGHVMRNGRKVVMKDFVPRVPRMPYACPTVLIIGTSMSCGKTFSSKSIFRALQEFGYNKIVGTKLTGAGFLNDKQTMEDVGADVVYDFVDVGLPSSIVPPDEYKTSLATLLSLIASEEPDVIVAELGASPLEKNNGDLVLDALAEKAGFTVLCASDVFSAESAPRLFGATGVHPNVTGKAASNSAGVELVRSLCPSTPVTSLNSTEGINYLKHLLLKAVKTENAHSKL